MTPPRTPYDADAIPHDFLKTLFPAIEEMSRGARLTDHAIEFVEPVPDEHIRDFPAGSEEYPVTALVLVNSTTPIDKIAKKLRPFEDVAVSEVTVNTEYELTSWRLLSEIFGEERTIKRVVERIHEEAAKFFRRHDDKTAAMLRDLAESIDDEAWKHREPRAKEIVDRCRQYSPDLPYRTRK